MVTGTKSHSGISEKLLSKLNEQIKLEFDSSYLYLSMSADMFDKGWEGLAHWLKAQAKEEEEHAFRIYNYLQERNHRVKLMGINAPKQDWASPLQAFSEAYDHERMITGKINDLYKLALEENDYPTQMMLQWFINEQVEEEGQTLKIVDDLRKVGDSVQGLYMLDHHLGKR
jgi:ferritin